MARNTGGEYSESPGTVTDHRRAEQYARALQIVLVASPYRGGLAALAKRMGYSREYVSRVVSVRCNPTEAFLERACVALGCEREMLDTLAGMHDDDHPLVQFLTRRFEQ